MAGGNAKCLELNDIDRDGHNDLLVGTDDFSIRFYKNENIIHEINENTEIVNLTTISENKFLYALENGTLGMYTNKERIWKKKVNLGNFLSNINLFFPFSFSLLVYK